MKKIITCVVLFVSLAVRAQVPQSDEQLAVVVAERLRMLQSIPLYMSWAKTQVKIIMTTMKPQGASPDLETSSSSFFEGPPELEKMADMAESLNLSIRLVAPVWVELTTSYLGTNGVFFQGSTMFFPQEIKGGWVIPDWVSPELRINPTVRVNLGGLGVRYVHVYLRDWPNGPITNGEYGQYINVNSDGTIDFPREVIENDGEIIVTAFDGRISREFGIHIRDGQYLHTSQLFGSVRPTVKGAVSLRDPAKILIQSQSHFGKGEDILTEVTFTGKGKVPVFVQTTEGEIPDEVVVIEVVSRRSSSYFPRMYPSAEFIMEHEAGTYDIVPFWNLFRDNSLNDTGGQKGGGTAGGGM